MNPSFTIICFLLPVFALSQEAKKKEDGPLILNLFHSFGSKSSFTPRGRLIVKSKGLVTYEGYAMSEDDASQLALLSNDSTHIYTLKAVESKSSDMSLTFTRVCSIFSPPYSEIISVNFDVIGKLIGVNIKGGNPSCLEEVVAEGSSPTSRKKQPTTTVSVSQTSPAPSPDTQTYLQRLEQEKVEKMKGSQQDNRSFLSKYWIYIVPLVIFMLIQSATNTEGRDGQ